MREEGWLQYLLNEKAKALVMLTRNLNRQKGGPYLSFMIFVWTSPPHCHYHYTAVLGPPSAATFTLLPPIITSPPLREYRTKHAYTVFPRIGSSRPPNRPRPRIDRVRRLEASEIQRALELSVQYIINA